MSLEYECFYKNFADVVAFTDFENITKYHDVYETL